MELPARAPSVFYDGVEFVRTESNITITANNKHKSFKKISVRRGGFSTLEEDERGMLLSGSLSRLRSIQV